MQAQSSGKGMKSFGGGRKNPNTTPARAKSAPATGNEAPYAKMPANNNGTFPVKLGSGEKSSLGSNVGAASTTTGATQPAGPRANIPSNNTTDKHVTLGHTKHGVGQVPNYLRNPGNSGSN